MLYLNREKEKYKLLFLDIRKYMIFIYMVIYGILGLVTCKDYYISWDEPVQRMHGLVTIKYILSFIDSNILNNSYD